MAELNPEALARLDSILHEAQAIVAAARGAPAPAAVFQPASAAWMTEEEELELYRELGFEASLAELRASYSGFAPSPKKPTTSPKSDTETDDLRNFYRLWKRTNHKVFLEQAKLERDWQVDIYSRSGKGTSIEASHVYLQGLTDWLLDHPDDQPAHDAARRILDFVWGHLPTTFIETRVVARPLLCLAYWREKMQDSSVDAPLRALANVVRTAPRHNDFLSWPKSYVGQGLTFQDQPANTDLRKLFPKNATHKGPGGELLIADATHWNLRPFPGVASFQDVVLMHALRVAARVLADRSLAELAEAQAKAWEQVCGFPWHDPTGARTDFVIGYNVVANAPEPRMFQMRAGASTPIYVSQYAAFCLEPAMRARLQRQAFTRAYGEYAKIDLAAEVSGKRPRYFAWQTWEQGYFLTQKA